METARRIFKSIIIGCLAYMLGMVITMRVRASLFPDVDGILVAIICTLISAALLMFLYGAVIACHCHRYRKLRKKLNLQLQEEFQKKSARKEDIKKILKDSKLFTDHEIEKLLEESAIN